MTTHDIVGKLWNLCNGQRKLRRDTFYGMEHVQDTRRLALINLMLHGIGG